MASSSLSSVVSNLVRASMGNSVHNSVTDDDLDRHVAELIVREAKKKAERYGQQGIRAYISNNIADSNAPKTNKRFLTSIIKSTDDHNKTILKAQALAAQEVKREREEQERRQRRARAEEAAEAERLRRSGRSTKRKRTSNEEGWDRWDGRTADRKKVPRNWESWDGYDEEDERRKRPRKHHASRSRSRSRSKDRRSARSRPSRAGEDVGDDETYPGRHRRARSRSASPRRNVSRDGSGREDSSRRRKRRRSPERSYRHSRRSQSRSSSPLPLSRSPSSQTEDSKPKKRRRSQSPKYALDDIRDESPIPRWSSPTVSESKPTSREAELRQRLKDSRQHQSETSTPPPKSLPINTVSEIDIRPALSKRSPSPKPSRSPSLGPQLPHQLPSKMDRYFEESYDPRLDVTPLTAPNVPATGLINNAEFEGWDAMLELIRIRREDKEEKKRLERLGLLPKEKSKVKKKGVIVDSAPAVADRWTGEAVSVMNIEYKKRGTVREWDMGKEILS
ncbi:hypothetical protein GALMADRAFT_218606 [Galerina marginata CBS 339.88]|uniref:Uncharacterized protein n=1 Tax=Galerina marginata (strain CBS 339.88) TaxID=685588 RepID=A0A067TZS8_GALM3|nr:hypothetical protein GALMADRAFT_218606 [Galerina marginata CBS 339.88]